VVAATASTAAAAVVATASASAAAVVTSTSPTAVVALHASLGLFLLSLYMNKNVSMDAS
jgi:hypothetical protein